MQGPAPDDDNNIETHVRFSRIWKPYLSFIILCAKWDEFERLCFHQQVRRIADIVARSNLVVDLAQAARLIAEVCQSPASRKYKAEIRKQGLLEQLISLADELDSMEGIPVREQMMLQESVFR
jgi:hypothetical protein